jgi:hypothetical protein
MQERSAIYTEPAVRALNLIDVVFNDSSRVREAWAELSLALNTRPIVPHVMDERLRRMLGVMADDIGLGGGLRTDDIGRVYYPQAIAQDRQIQDMQRQQTLRALQGASSPAANTASGNSPWPPKPE